MRKIKVFKTFFFALNMLELSKIEGVAMNKDEKKEEKKEQKEKALKKSADKKPKEPIDRQDILCYVGSFIFAFLAILPFLMRTFDANYEMGRDEDSQNEESRKEVKISTLNCNKTVEEEGYSYKTEIASSFTNNYVSSTTITYEVTMDPAYNIAFEDVEIPEYTTISEINSPGIGRSLNEHIYTLKIDYNLDQTLRNNELLDAHNKLFDVQRSNYEGNGYICIYG